MSPSILAQDAASQQFIAERLERGEVLYYPVCPFELPEGDDHRFLLDQRLASRAHKNVSYAPDSGKVGGLLKTSPEQAERTRQLLATFASKATAWAASLLPRYARHWERDRVSYRPEEEATRKLRLTARNDLLHVDAFPSRPSNGCRIMRVFANINPAEPRVWITGEPFAKLFERFGQKVGLPSGCLPSWSRRLQDNVLQLFQPGRRKRSAYDEFMLRFHDFLKANEDYQEFCPRKYWYFQPGSAWVCLTDTCSHAVLRGRFALEHSYFIAPESQALPEEAPAAILARASGCAVLNAAA